MRAALRRMPQAGEWLGNFRARTEDLEIKEWRVRAALLDGDWAEVMRHLYRLPEEERLEDHWAYWEARALEVAGHTDQARDIYSSIAGLQSWHGFLAADRLGEDYVIVDEPIEPEVAVLDAMASDERLLRARDRACLDIWCDAARKRFYPGSGVPCGGSRADADHAAHRHLYR